MLIIGILSIVLLGDFPGYAIAGVHEDDPILNVWYQLACMVGHTNTCN